MANRKIGEILLGAGLINSRQLVEALQDQDTYGGKLGGVLFEKCYITEKEYLLALSSQMGLPAVDFYQLRIREDVIKMIPEDVAWEQMVLPVQLKETPEGEVLVVAMADPHDEESMQEIRKHTEKTIEPAIALENSIRHVLMDYYQNRYGHGDYVLEEEIVSNSCHGRETRSKRPTEPVHTREVAASAPSAYLGGPGPEEGGNGSMDRDKWDAIMLEDRLSKEHALFSTELRAFLTLLIRKGITTPEEYLGILKELRSQEVEDA